MEMEIKMLKKSIVLITLFLVSGISYAELKIGFVDVARVLESAPQAEQAKKRLEKEFSPRDKLLVAQQKKIKDMEEKLKRDSAVLSEAEGRKTGARFN